MQGYPNFGKVKTIVLPLIQQSQKTGKEYLEEFGINILDLLEFKMLTNGLVMSFKNHNALHLFNIKLEEDGFASTTPVGVQYVNMLPELSGQNECGLVGYISLYDNEEAKFIPSVSIAIRMTNNAHTIGEITLEDITIQISEF